MSKQNGFGFSRLLNAIFAFATFTSLQAVAAPVAVRPDLVAFEKTIETRIESQVRQYLGEKSRVMIAVRATPASVKRGGEALETTDVGYAPLPISYDEFAPTREQNPFELDSLAVTIGVPEGTTESAIAAIRGITESVTQGLNATISLKKFPLGDPPAAPPQPEKSLKEKLLGAEQLAGLIGTAIAAIFAVLCFAILAFGLIRAGSIVVAGLQNIHTSNQTANKPIQVDLNAEGLDLKGGGADAEKTASDTSALPENHPAIQQDYPRNLAIVKDILRTKPALFLESVEDSDVSGLKHLLPNLDETEQNALRDTLGEARLKKLADPGAAALKPERFAVWLNEFVERLFVHRLHGGSELQKLIGPDRTLRLHSAKKEQIVAAIKEMGAPPAAWRVGVDFTPAELLQEALASAGDEEWRKIVEAGNARPEEAVSAADQIIARLERQPGADVSSQLREKYFSGNLLNSVVTSLGKKKVAELDGFLDGLEATSPDFIATVRKHVWTPRILERVPSRFLTMVLGKLKMEQRVAIVATLPEAYSNQVMSLLPEGNIKTIVTDMVRRLREKPDPNAEEENDRLCREFLDYLKREADAGKFKLEDPTESLREFKAA